MDNSLDSLKIPPHSDDAECSFLSAVFERNSLIDDVDSVITSDDFYRHENQIIFRRMLGMSVIGQPIDPVTLCGALSKSGEDSIVSQEYVVELATSGRGAHNAIHYSTIIRDKAIDRKLISHGYEIAEIGYSDGESADKIDKAQALIMDSASENAGEVQDINSALKELVDSIDLAHKNRGKITGIETGYAELDKILYGMQAGDDIVMAGRPGMGKTTLAMNIAEHAVINQKKNVLIFSLEMPRIQLLQRMACSLGKVPHDMLKRGDMDGHWQGLTAAVSKLKDSSLLIDDRSILTSEQLISRARKIKKRMGGRLDFIVIDYIQLMADKGDGVERVTKISRNIKLAAKELGCPIIAISQLSRKCEERGDKRPISSDLRESGAIEQDADVIIMLYRDELYDPDSHDKGIAEVLIRKHRNGEIGVVKLASNLRFSRFDNLDASRIRESDQRYLEEVKTPKSKTFSYARG